MGMDLRRLHPRRRSAERLRQSLNSGGGFSPLQISAVAGWLRLAAGTVTGAGFSSVPDLLNPANPAVQGTDGSRPPLLLSANGLPTADFDGTADHLSWPAAANNSQTTTAGFGFWFRTDTVTPSTVGMVGCIPGAGNRFEMIRTSGLLVLDVYLSQFSSRRGETSTVISADTWYFVTWEFEGAGADDAAKCTITLNTSVLSLTFSNSAGAPGAMPATLVAAQTIFFGSRQAGLGFFNGKLGPNWYWFGSKMSGATQGLLTPAARTALMGFDQPT